MRLLSALCTIACCSFSMGSQSAEPDLVGSTILLGQSAPFSGPSSQLATEFNLGARTYFQSVNEAGGVAGRKIELRTRDDAYDPTRTAQNTQDLIEKDGVFALFTDATSGVTTYDACRSLRNASPAVDGSAWLDFNRAVNLPCAYTVFATCPLPPAENRLPVGIEAGEKTPLSKAGDDAGSEPA
jgi:hypothetical protein